MMQEIDLTKACDNFDTATMDGEIWAAIDGFNGYYQISNYGRVKRIRDGWPVKMLRISRDSRGYPHTSLHFDKTKTTIKIHRLVANAFIPNPEGKRTINHINGIKTDNRVENLEWMTDVENVRHAVESKLRIAATGDRHGMASITNDTAIEIKKLISNGMRGCEIARKVGVNPAIVYSIKSGTCWKNITID